MIRVRLARPTFMEMPPRTLSSLPAGKAYPESRMGIAFWRDAI